MDSSSGDTLSILFQQVVPWVRRVDVIQDEVKFQWSDSHLSVVQSYVSRFCLHSDFQALSNCANLFVDSLLYATPGSYAKTVVSFTRELQVIFRVPRRHQLLDRGDTLTESELLAAFINFLLQLLCHRTDFTNLFKDQIGRFEKELRSLLTVLGDTILLHDEHERVRNLLAEFEAVSNEAGSLVHSFFFSVDPVLETMDEGLAAVFKHIARLTANVIDLLCLLPLISRARITPRTSVVDSLVILDSLFNDLTDLINREDNLIPEVKDQFKFLQQGLISLLLLIQDIGGLRPSMIGELKEPLMQIGDVACEAEYLINSFLVGDASLLYFTTRLTDVIGRIELIVRGLQEIKNNNDIGALKVAKKFRAQLALQAKTTSEVEVDEITVGFADKATDILDLLVGGTSNQQIISIFGMPGLGKTTLAKKLYNHLLVKHRFDRCSWCVVSQTYHRKYLLIDILVGLKSELDKDKILKMDEENVGEHIHKILKGRRYLIVMDDVWSSSAWYDLKRCFPDDGNGSRILFTSRNKDVAPPGSINYALPSLSNDQCWELLEKKVFHNKPCPSQLTQTGKEIAANCCGLPLAVVVIAGILSTIEKEKTTWTKVGRNLTSYIYSGQNNSTMQILELSYEHLSDHLKPCFLYFGAMPEDKEIPVRKLLQLWIAEGFIRKQGRKSSESVAEEYLRELIDKSLVMISGRRSDGGVKTCILHDLLRDLCLRKCEEEDFLKRYNYSVYVKGHRILLPWDSQSPFGQHVRSFHGYPLEYPFHVINMKLLRVLNFKAMMNPRYLFGTEFPVQLRYLVVADLPASIGSLVNLEFLVVKMSRRIVIPSAMVKMKKLRYANLSPTASFDEDCNSSQANNLEFLSNVVVRNVEDEEMLKCSPHLRELKCIWEPISLVEQGVYRYPDLCFHTQLESLNMENLSSHSMAEIKLPTNIKKLTLSCLRLPWEQMSIIGRLPKLEVLKLASDAFEGETWETRDGEFEQFIFLKLEEINTLAHWNVDSCQNFPKLQKLILRDCPKLREIPSEVGEIGSLQSIEVQMCSKLAQESAIKIQQEQQEMGNEELRFVIEENWSYDTTLPWENILAAHEEPNLWPNS